MNTKSLVSFLCLMLFGLVYGRSADSQSALVMCKLPEVRGHCRALLPRWRYNPSTRRCEEFKFGGCDGNGNNFMSYTACMSVCEGI